MFSFDNSYVRLPERFYAKLAPAQVDKPQLIDINAPLASDLDIDPGWLASPQALAVLSGNAVPEGADPLAMAYAGHQFGHFVPQLGDGRAILLGEVRGRDGALYDIQLKGSGRTPYSRTGDGRAALGPVLREFIVSEAMHALGIPTTRALAAVTTGDLILREQGPLPGAVLTRVASSHVRVGTFEFFAARGDWDGVRLLADYAIARLYPEVARVESRYLALLESVIERTAELIARWQCVGFIHGVMNTDNTSIAGETIDYGPCAFMDAYDPATVFSSIDRHGRYAYDQQPRIAWWNLTRFAESLLPVLGEGDAAASAARQALDSYPVLFEAAHARGLRAKFGLSEPHEDDLELIHAFLHLMTDAKADFTLSFRRLCDAAEGNEHGLRETLGGGEALRIWLDAWRRRLALETISPGERATLMRQTNPLFVPRNHRVEAVIRAAEDRSDFAPFKELMNVLSAPYEDQPDMAHYADPPKASELVLQTFCGT